MPAAEHPPAPKAEIERPPLWVDPAFQLRAFVPLVLFAGVCAALFYPLVLYPLKEGLTSETDLGIRAILAAQLDDAFSWRLWSLFAGAGLLAAYVSFYQALRVVRPIYRLHQALQALAAGEHPTLRLEPGEAFRFFEDDVSQLNQKMKLIAARNRDILYGVSAHVTKLASRLAADEVIPRADLEEFVGAVRSYLEKAPEIGVAGRH